MKTTLTGVILLTLIFAGAAGAEEGQKAVSDQTKAEVSADTEAAKPVEVGNKICPVSGEKVGGMGDVVKIEHEGKVYNLCCAMCKKDFQKDSQKYIDKVNEEMKAAGEQK